MGCAFRAFTPRPRPRRRASTPLTRAMAKPVTTAGISVTAMGFAALNPSYASMPAPCPDRRAEARPRPGPSALPPTRWRSSAMLPMRRSRFRILRCQTAQFLRCRRVAASGFFAFPSFSQLPIPRPRGWRSAGRRYPLFCRARNRATPRLRGVGRPAQPGRRLTALHRDGFGPSPRSAPPELPPGAPGGRPSLPGACVRSAEGPEPPGHGLRAAAGTPPPAPPSGSSPETPLDERDFGKLLQARYVVNPIL